MKVAIYARISTNEKRQNLQTQLKLLQEFVKARKWAIQETHIDQAIGSKEERIALNKLVVDDAGKRIVLLNALASLWLQ